MIINQIYDKKKKQKITLYKDKVVLERDKDGWIKAIHQEIFLDKISSIEVQKLYLLDGYGPNAGAMFFLISGTNTRYDACFIFTWKKHYEAVIQLKEQIENLMLKNNRPESTPSVADELVKLKSLLDSGILTSEEFEKAKQKLIN